MSYIDAFYNKNSDKISVVERDTNNKRQYKEYPANYKFYYPDNKGKFRGTDGVALSRFSTNKRGEFEKEKRIHGDKTLYESDINVVFRCLSENYLKTELPTLHTAFFDIEVDWTPAEVDENIKVKIRKKSNTSE